MAQDSDWLVQSKETNWQGMWLNHMVGTPGRDRQKEVYRQGQCGCFWRCTGGEDGKEDGELG
jgi:hypothetical protein